MSEERAERGAGAAVRASERGSLHSVEAADEISVELAEPEAAEPAPPARADAAPPSDGRVKGAGEGGGSRRPRNRMTLRIPDDEVVRPSSGGDSPAAPAVSETVPAAHVTEPDEEPVSAPTPDTTPSPSAADLAPVPPSDGSLVPPDPPTIRLPSSPDTMADLGDLARTARALAHAGDTLQGLSAVTAAQAEEIATTVVPDSPALAASSMRLPAATLPYADPLPEEAAVPVLVPASPAAAVHPVVEPAAPAPAAKPPKPPELPPRAPRQSSIDIPVEEDFVEAPVSESAPPLDLDLERLSSRPSPPEPSLRVVQLPPSPPAPRVELAPASPPPLPVTVASPSPGAAAVATGVAPVAPVSPAAVDPVAAEAPAAPASAPIAPASGPAISTAVAGHASPGLMPVAAVAAAPAVSKGAEPPAWLAAARPPALALLAPEEEEEASPVSSSRPSEPGDAHEVSPEDVVSVESVRDGVLGRVPPPAPLPRVQVTGSAGRPAAAAVAPPPSPAARAPVAVASSGAGSAAAVAAPVAAAPAPAAASAVAVNVLGASPAAAASVAHAPSASPLAPPPMSEGAAAVARRRVRPWWEELFNDDFIRTMAKITDEQISMEADFIEESLGVAKGAMVLDLACGTGRHAIELTRRGYQVVGFDLSLAMLARAADEAQDRNQKLNFVQGDMRDMTFEDTFDGVYCWSTSFGYFEEEKNAQVVLNVRRALKKGGQFLLDVSNRDFIARQSPSVAWFEGDGCVCMDEMNVDWITSRMRVKRTMMMDDGRTKETEYSIRVYSLHELGKLLHDSGFRVADVSGRTATPGVFLGADSPRTLILAEKR